MIGGAAKAGWPGWVRRLAAAGFAASVAVSTVRAESLASPGCLDGGSEAVVTGIEPDLGLRLADGRLVQLAGIDGHAPAPKADDRLRQWLAAQTVRVLPLGRSDRWGRTPAVVFAANGADGRPVSVGEALLDAGLARARPSGAVTPCWAAYLRLEAEARDARRGLWADAAAGVIAADETVALRSHLGDFVVVGGTVASLYEGPKRTYLRFGAGPRDGVAVSYERRIASRLARAGLTADALLHRRLRVRGLLDDRWGLQIEVDAPEQIEVLAP